jgi:hypothetical protein
MARARSLLAALLCLVSSSAWADLRTYDVDSQYRQEIFSALRNLLNPDPAALNAQTGTYGTVQLLPSGQILVNANASTLEQVEQLLSAIRARPAVATPRVTLRYWAVLGTSAGTTVTGRPGSTRPPSGLQEVLTELKRFHGDLQFQVIGTAAVVSESGQPGEIEGSPLSASQRAHVQGDTLNAEIRIELNQVFENGLRGDALSELEVRTSLKRGEFVVLGETTQQGSGFDGTLFYIVHWPE